LATLLDMSQPKSLPPKYQALRSALSVWASAHSRSGGRPLSKSPDLFPALSVQGNIIDRALVPGLHGLCIAALALRISNGNGLNGFAIPKTAVGARGQVLGLLLPMTRPGRTLYVC